MCYLHDLWVAILSCKKETFWKIFSLRWSSHLGNEAFFSFTHVFTQVIGVRFGGEDWEITSFTCQNHVSKCYRENVSLFSDTLSPTLLDNTYIYFISRNPFMNGFIINFIISFQCPRIHSSKPWADEAMPQLHFCAYLLHFHAWAWANYFHNFTHNSIPLFSEI